MSRFHSQFDLIFSVYLVISVRIFTFHMVSNIALDFKKYSSEADLSRNVRKCTSGHVGPLKILIRLRIRAVWSESSMGTSWLAKDVAFLHADNEASDQTAQMRRLIWIFFGRMCQKVRFLKLRLL